ncbi:DUF421 domain-containing protein [Tellurirhabdus rosea]|uniref:DUF421 domain-containing protein n=1 Tax=Tellurirhabdus rosea TaxID=2674997 RepID=UPI00224F4BCB|nr:YetF domain-containing protein [Tellurirhabdus rosea]
MSAPGQADLQPFDWHRMLIDNFPWLYLGEVALRTLVMFSVILFSLKLSGKREVRQLSVFELVLIVGLGSAAGDPMLYHDVPLLSALVVFVVMISCYRLVTALILKQQKVEEFLLGKPVYIIKEGQFSIEDFDSEDLSLDEFFSELRQSGVEHLGQVRSAIREPNGEMSVYFYPNPETRYGLPILPDDFRMQMQQIGCDGYFACCFCGNVKALRKDQICTCERCKNHTWVMARRTERVT